MPVITPVPIHIQCSACLETLASGHLDIESDSPIGKSWIIVDYINIKCPKCKAIIQDSSDDFTRIIEAMKDEEDDDN